MNTKTIAIAAAVLLLAPMLPGGALAFHSAGGRPEQGKKIYQGTCIACHGPDGKGLIPGTPNFTASDGPLSKPNDLLLQHVTNGFQRPGTPIAMPPKGGNPALSETDLKDVIAYLHENFRH